MTAADRARTHDLVLLLVDAPEDVVTARYAAASAAAGTRVLAAVVLPGVEPGVDAAGTVRHRREAAAVAGRVRPVLEARDVAVTSVPLLLPSGRSTWTRWRLRRVLRLLARRSGARLLVVPRRQVLGLAPEQVARMVPGGVVARTAQDAPRPGAVVRT
jgi:hypothetical protein